MNKISKLDFKGQQIYVGMDAHKKSWSVSIHTDKAISSMERFDVVGVVSDYIVGGKDTLSILEEIKDRQPQNIPVIMYSGRYDVPYKEFEELGIQCFAKYNTNPKNLVSHIKMGSLEDNK